MWLFLLVLSFTLGSKTTGGERERERDFLQLSVIFLYITNFGALVYMPLPLKIRYIGLIRLYMPCSIVEGVASYMHTF